MVDDLNSDPTSVSGEIGEPGQDRGAPIVGAPASPAAASGAGGDASSDERSGASARGEGQASAGAAQLDAPPVRSAEAETEFADAKSGAGDQADAALPANASGAVAAHSLASALSALDRRDYGTARRLFEALGRKDAAEAVDSALAALDRKDFSTAQGLFEALAAPKFAAPIEDRAAPEALAKDEPKETELAQAPIEVVAVVAPERREAAAPSEMAKTRRARPLVVAAGVALMAIVVVSVLYGSQRGGLWAAAKSQASAGFASVLERLEAPWKSAAGPGERDDERAAVRDLAAALAQATSRLDRIERETGARLDALGERVDQNAASRLPEIAARLDALEQRTAAPASAPDLAGTAARLETLEKRVAAASQPSAQWAELSARLDRLDKKAAAQTASAAKPLPPTAPKHPTLAARAQPYAENDFAGAPRRLLRDYAVEAVQGGMALVDGRYGPQQVAPGDFLPGAGRVLRIERRGGDWVVLTSNGVIESAPAPY